MRPYFTAYLPSLFLAAILTPAAVVVIAVYDCQSAVIVLIALPLIPIFMVLIGLVTADRSAAALAAMTTLQSRLLDLVAGIPTLRALGRVGGSADRIAELGAAHRRSAMATLRIAFLSALVLELLATLGVALVAVSVGLRLVFGEMTLAAGLTALLLAPEVFWPLRRVGLEFHAAQDGKTAADNGIPAARHPRASCAGGHRSAPVTAPIAHRRSSVPMSSAGSVTVLTGPNGAGKTTLLQAILGLDAPRVGPHPRQRRRRGRPRPARMVAPGGLAGAAPGAGARARCRTTSSCSARCPTSTAPAARPVSTTCSPALPDGLQTVIGRGGVGLSLGQRQRLGLARVLGSAAPVLLLDEPTAHLDAASEERVLRAIAARAADGATVVVVGHRDPVLAIGDRVLAHRGSRRVDALIHCVTAAALLRPRLPRLRWRSRSGCCRWAARWR